MGWLATLRAALTRRSTPGQYPGGAPRSYTRSELAAMDAVERAFAIGGAGVNEHTALTLSAVWSAVRIISETLAALPAPVYRRATRGRERDGQHTVDWLLNHQANPEMSGFTLRETMTAHCLLWGNAYAEIERDGRGMPVWLWPLEPHRVQVQRDENGAIRYRVKNAGDQETDLLPSQMLHIRGLGYDGVIGYSVVRMAARSMGAGLQMDAFSESFFENGAMPGHVLKHPSKLSEEQIRDYKRLIDMQVGGAGKAGSTLILSNGLDFTNIGMPLEDAQFIEQRKFGVNEVARWFRIPSHKLADLERATLNNVEQQNIEFGTDTITPWAVRWETEANLKLFGQIQRGTWYVRHNLDALLRGDFKSRMEGYAQGRQWGWLSADDVRELEEMNPLPDGAGETYLVPVNMTDAAQLRRLSAAQADKAEADAETAANPPEPQAIPFPAPRQDEPEETDA